MRIVAIRKLWYGVSIVLVLASLAAVAVWGLPLGIDFSGGANLEFKFSTAPTAQQLREDIKTQGVEATVIVTEQGLLARMPEINNLQRETLVKLITTKYSGSEELSFELVGASIGKELKGKATTAVLVALVLIMSYIAWSFRRVSGRIQSWKYGTLVAVSGLHDVIIPIGVFAVLGHFRAVEVDSSFIAAILTILGYSINDTIVVFDRVRENILKTTGKLEDIVEAGIRQSIPRSINTTLTVIFALLAIYFFGGESTKNFALALAIGFGVGAYSSIFIAAPLLVSWQRRP